MSEVGQQAGNIPNLPNDIDGDTNSNTDTDTGSSTNSGSQKSSDWVKMESLPSLSRSSIANTKSDENHKAASGASQHQNNIPSDSIISVEREQPSVKLSCPFSPHTILHAATLLEDAQAARFINFKPDLDSIKLYVSYYQPVFQWLQYIAVFIILALVTIEEPSIWRNAVPYWGCSIIEVVCLAYLGFRVIHLASFQHKTDFWKDKKNIVVIILILLNMIDIISFLIWRNSISGSDGLQRAIRWSRPLRPLYIINFPHARQIRRAFRNIRRTVLEVVFVLILFLCSVMIFALMALKLFGKRNLETKYGEPYFKDYINALWNLYVLVTTANNPDVMMPAYDNNNWSALFFIIFLFVNLYIFMNILLAVIFNSYKKHLKNEVREAVYNKRRKLAEAYELVKEEIDGSDFVDPSKSRYYMSLATWTRLMRVLSPSRSQEQIKMLFQVLDGDGDGKLTKAEFLTAADVLNIPLTEVSDRMILWQKLFPIVFNSYVSRGVRIIVSTRWFRYSFDFAIVLNAVFIAVDVPEAEYVFLALFTIEILLKFYAYGPKGFVSQYWNLFDVLVIGGAIIATFINELNKLEADAWDFILVLRVLRLIRLVNGFDRFKVVITTLANIGPSMITYGGVLFTFYYTFAVIGMEIFQYRINYYGSNTYNLTLLSSDKYYCGNEKLKGSEFFYDRYCSNNFNDISKALVVLTELTVVNQWHVLTSGFEMVTHPATRIYFFLFHLVVVVLIMNIFLAFILEAFILEYSLSKSRFETSVETKIMELGYALGQQVGSPKNKSDDKVNILDTDENASEHVHIDEDGTRFHISHSSKNVEVLLQRMFEDELDPEDMGDFDKLEDERPGRKYTLDQIVM